MQKLDTRQDWEKAFRKIRIREIASCVISSVLLIFVVVILQVLLDDIKWELIIVVTVLITYLCTLIYGVASVTSSGIKEWKKRLLKNEELTCKEYATGIEYQLELIGLESLNKLEFRKKR
jgi:5-bromo-4-chloroindolyl phosphate hydrolysis protein